MMKVSKAEFAAKLAEQKKGESCSSEQPSPSCEDRHGQRKTAGVTRRDYTCPSVAEYRGTTAVSKPAASKNVAEHPTELSLPTRQVPEGFHKAHRVGNDITKHAADALLIGHGNIYRKENCVTSKGWQPGKFV